MKPLLAIALALLPIAVSAAPVHVSLKSSAAVQPDADNYFSLGSVADLTGGDAKLRAKLALVCVGRAPLPGDVREITRGDLVLKLRQAGFPPGADAVLEGATQADVTVTASASAGVPANSAGTKGVSQAAPAAPVILVRRGDSVTIRIDDDDMSITARGVARDNGAAGDTIHIHRDGCNSDLVATVLDAQTVSLEL